MAISEIGAAYADYTFGKESRKGIPFTYLLRDVLQFDQDRFQSGCLRSFEVFEIELLHLMPFENSTSLSMTQNSEWKMPTELVISFLALVMAKMKFSTQSDILIPVSFLFFSWYPDFCVSCIPSHGHSYENVLSRRFLWWWKYGTRSNLYWTTTMRLASKNWFCCLSRNGLELSYLYWKTWTRDQKTLGRNYSRTHHFWYHRQGMTHIILPIHSKLNYIQRLALVMSIMQSMTWPWTICTLQLHLPMVLIPRPSKLTRTLMSNSTWTIFLVSRNQNYNFCHFSNKIKSKSHFPPIQFVFDFWAISMFSK